LFYSAIKKLQWGSQLMNATRISVNLNWLPISILTLIFCIISSATIAQNNSTSPIYFKVSGVAINDVLNARAGPSSSSEIVGSLARNASPVEVFRQRNGWAQVTVGEQMGWVSKRFLSEIKVSNISKTTLPEGLSCGGTEPLWGLEIKGGQLNYTIMDQSKRVFVIYESDKFHNLGGSTSFVLAQGSGEQLTAIVSNQICSDGMSDRIYPRRIDLLFSINGNTVGQSGCCHLPSIQ